jgi:glycosyltransferase involved in cell wall biosynthesis
MKTENLQSISIIIPTYNSGRTLSLCLDSISIQAYPYNLVEIIIADAGSSDDTLRIIEEFKKSSQFQDCRVIRNPLKTGEAGKAAGVKHASREIVVLIDSDNILPQKDWLLRMVEAFCDPEIVATEPIEYTYRKTDGFITRYCALIGMNDPLCMYLGNYDRYNVITGKWTEMPVISEDKGNYLRVTLDPQKLPTIGANGFCIRYSALKQCEVTDYLFDIDILAELLQKNPNLKVAKVKIGIIHIFSGDVSTFVRKQKRRIKDFFYFSKANLRKFPWSSISKARRFKFIIYCTLGIPLIVQSLIGYRRKPDRAWFFHTPACWITLFVYGWGTVLGKLRPAISKRERWSQ